MPTTVTAPVRALRGVAVLSPWLAHLLAVDLLLSLMLPLKPLAPTVVYNVSSILANSVWSWIQRIFTRLNRADIVLSTNCPAGLPRGESAVVIANHVAWSDFYMIQEAARHAGMLGRCRWFAKRSLRWVPFLGWGLWAMGMPLVSRSWATDRAELERVFRGIVSNRWPVWLISYSEGTRFTPARHAAAVSYRAAGNKPPPPSPYLLVPRPRGFAATVTALRRGSVESSGIAANSHVRAVLDVTIAYAHGSKFMQAPPFWETIANGNLSRGPSGYRFYAHVNRWDMDQLPEGEEALAEWLEERWKDKGKRLEELKTMLDRGEEWVGDENVDAAAAVDRKKDE
ncbi:Phospholipid/glycerol acyltransferase [Lasiodiplodia theobromae]|uniref:1-acyl-sn-glycerol-3-phosphate acyltransferase PLS1 n=1 Tax=Lasiodiplodia theobromae TaxID=45133 RepID=A0A5N5DJM3_9PEZI|nr:Phospholipid/glycerol acyltransferase [Lasiodiplodia theobromae]KAB2577780.1 1-acyl-sn-glycerol-3-phosphate acyltransferase PLS1 [Lasiodiplodia theobromae]KAF4537101.1 Phospholipid/glycerol acyltransferase [Lasiodiplodia theobromae]KAF9633630.1 Phospholipid/glycerol acyltransferase [Lasiodiplodia theobromae]